MTLLPPPPEPILALDVPNADAALALLERVGPDADFVKVGLQLFVAEGPAVVRTLRDRGLRVFLDLKLHDIPNTVAHAVESAAGLGVELLTVHASGGAAMLRAARRAADASGDARPRLIAVTVLTSLAGREVAEAWGREGDVAPGAEAARLATLAAGCGMDGVVASVHEVEAIHGAAGAGFGVLTPGIRLPGDDAGDQARIATPADAARAGSRWIVLGRSVTAAADPAEAFARVRAELEAATGAEVGA